jgi:hypothetical protein
MEKEKKSLFLIYHNVENGELDWSITDDTAHIVRALGHKRPGRITRVFKLDSLPEIESATVLLADVSK